MTKKIIVFVLLGSLVGLMVLLFFGIEASFENSNNPVTSAAKASSSQKITLVVSDEGNDIANSKPDEIAENQLAYSEIEPCDQQLLMKKTDKRVFLIPEGLPDEIYNLQGDGYRNAQEGLLGISYDRASEILEACHEWSSKLDKSLKQEVSITPLDHISYQQINSLKESCKNMHTRVIGQFKLDGINPKNSALGSNFNQIQTIKALAKNNNWSKFIDLVKRGDIPTDLTFTLAKGIKIYGNNLVFYALGANMPKKYLQQLIDLGAPVTAGNYEYLLKSPFPSVETGLNFLEIMEQKGVDLSQPFNQTTLQGFLLQYPVENPHILQFIKQHPFNANQIYFGTEDLLSRALKKHQKLLAEGYRLSTSSIEILIENGAQVLPKHLEMIDKPEVKKLLNKHQCKPSF
ncbi:hypothetical protein AVO42_01425 [Thiomicrospira sp. XS5]|uniref:hypothetical protein n=1 Tax=Thiomicrospira sp. XS5 TaxID=1775636 RepID=UPI00074ADD00|nr:hypothetical protein [Thiomicrospira sp. XS5]KUJ74104.1 hypothetical protein AVO42_01425 [Thiomicrospira sp. XS5]